MEELYLQVTHTFKWGYPVFLILNNFSKIVWRAQRVFSILVYAAMVTRPCVHSYCIIYKDYLVNGVN